HRVRGAARSALAGRDAPHRDRSRGAGQLQRKRMSDTAATLCVLGFDVGARRIGVAVGNTVSGTARPIAMVAARDEGPDWDAVSALVREWRPDRLVVGEPLTLD